jgi:hypothetical protein
MSRVVDGCNGDGDDHREDKVVGVNEEVVRVDGHVDGVQLVDDGGDDDNRQDEDHVEKVCCDIGNDLESILLQIVFHKRVTYPTCF